MRVERWPEDLAVAAALLVAVAFAVAALTKATRLQSFVAEVSDYRVLPAAAALPVAMVLPLVEAGAGVATAIPGSRAVGGWTILVLLVVFTAAIVANLRRGRRHIRCACFGSQSQRLSEALPLRNGLMAAAVLPAAVGADRLPEWPSVGAWCGALLAAATAAVLVEGVRMRESTRGRTR